MTHLTSKLSMHRVDSEVAQELAVIVQEDAWRLRFL